MATASVTASPSGRVTFWVILVLWGQLTRVSYGIARYEVTCDMEMLDMTNEESGVIESRLPDHIPIYANEDQRCDIYISVPNGYEMMFYFDWLDLYSTDRTRCDNVNIELFDGSPNQRVQGLEGQICGQEEQMPTNVYFIYHQHLIIRVNAVGVVQGTGFHIHFTTYRRAFPCARDEFPCETFGSKRCIDDTLVCDGWNDCGDWMDEMQDCNALTDGGIVAIVLVCVGLIALIVGLIIFCKIRRSREIRRLSDKETAIMRDDTASSRGGFSSPFSISSETMEKEKYIPRYSTGRNSARRSQAPGRAQDYEEKPPPYTERPSFTTDDDEDTSRSREGEYDDQEPPRSRQKGRTRSKSDDVFDDDEDVPRMRRGRTRSQEGRTPSRVDDPPRSREDRYPSRKDDREPSPSRNDRQPRDRNDRYAPRDNRYPSRRDEPDSPQSDRYSRDRDRDSNHRGPPRDNRNPSRSDDHDSDSRHSPDDDRDRYPSRRGDRDRNRERPQSRRGDPEDRYSYGDDEEPLDQLHPLREQKRRSVHTDSDPDTLERRTTPPRDSQRHPPRDDRETPRPNRSRDREDDRPAPREGRRDDLQPTRDRDERRSSPRDPRDREPHARNDRPPSRSGDRPERRREPPPNPDDSYDSGRDAPSRGNRRSQRRDSPPPPDEDFDDAPPRNRNRGSRSRDRQDRPRSNRYDDDDRGGSRGTRNREPEENPHRSRVSHGGYKEESV